MSGHAGCEEAFMDIIVGSRLTKRQVRDIDMALAVNPRVTLVKAGDRDAQLALRTRWGGGIKWTLDEELILQYFLAYGWDKQVERMLKERLCRDDLSGKVSNLRYAMRGRGFDHKGSYDDKVIKLFKTNVTEFLGQAHAAMVRWEIPPSFWRR